MPNRSHLTLLPALLPVLIAALMPGSLFARPLLTENVETVGKYSFEPSFAISQRSDTFGFPQATYKTVTMPVEARLGIHPNADLGFGLEQLSQRIETDTAQLSGRRFYPLF